MSDQSAKETGYLVPPAWLEQYFAEHMPDMLAWLASAPDAADEPEVPPARRMRLYRKIRVLRGRLAYRAFRIIAGYEVPESEDW